jgi:aryl-alcohol dehydrogenase-like predicted oxidoreductase
MKLALGTANFGQKYGLIKKKVTKKEIIKILNICKNNNIRLIDTAINYGDAEIELGKFDLSFFKICTKLPKIPYSKKKDVESWVIENINQSLKNLNLKKIDYVLMHSTDQFNLIRSRVAYNFLQDLKKKNIIKKIGYSIYSTAELKKFYKKYKPDVIQAPYNVLDRRIKNTGWLKKLKKEKVEVLGRSIFLKGLLISSLQRQKKKFPECEKTWSKWNSINNNNKNSLRLCLNYAMHEKNISKFIIGVKNAKELKQIIKFSKFKIKKIEKNKIDMIQINSKKILEPFRWDL